MFTRGSGSRETDFADARILQQRFADDPARPGNNVEHARRQSGFMENLNNLNVRQWCRAGGFDHNGVSRNESRTDLIAQQRYREIPRHNRTAHADGFFDDHSITPVIKGGHISAPDGLGQTGVVLQRVGKPADLEDSFLEGFALFFCEKPGEFLLTLFQDVRRGEKNLGALRRRNRRPFLK